MLYKIWTFVLESDTPLPELSPAHDRSPDYIFRLLPEQAHETNDVHWFHHWLLPAGEIWLSFARENCGYLLRFHDLADFTISSNGKELCCHPVSDTPLETIKHLLLDQVLPLVFSKHGRLVIHASAVVAQQGAVAFVGVTGRGKSTLAASFSMCGFPLMTDDCLLLEEKEGRLFVTPSYPGVRLWDDVIDSLFEHLPAISNVAHYTSKKRLSWSSARLPFSTGSVPIRRIYFLDSQDEREGERAIRIAPLSPRAAFLELVSYTFKLDIDDQDMLKREFMLFDRIASRSLFYRLTFPHDFSLLPDVRQAILRNLQET